MEKESNTKLTLAQARMLYHSGNDSFKEIALSAFGEDELQIKQFQSIKTLEDACYALSIDFNSVLTLSDELKKTSVASAAMYRLNIAKKALNLGQEFKLIGEPKKRIAYYPVIGFCADRSMKGYDLSLIGSFFYDGMTMYAFYDSSDIIGGCGLSTKQNSNNLNYTHITIAYLGCSNEEIAAHFIKYFSGDILESMYGDLDGFKMIF